MDAGSSPAMSTKMRPRSSAFICGSNLEGLGAEVAAVDVHLAEFGAAVEFKDLPGLRRPLGSNAHLTRSW